MILVLRDYITPDHPPSSKEQRSCTKYLCFTLLPYCQRPTNVLANLEARKSKGARRISETVKRRRRTEQEGNKEIHNTPLQVTSTDRNQSGVEGLFASKRHIKCCYCLPPGQSEAVSSMEYAVSLRFSHGPSHSLPLSALPNIRQFPSISIRVSLISFVSIYFLAPSWPARCCFTVEIYVV